MKKYFPIIGSIIVVTVASYFVVTTKGKEKAKTKTVKIAPENIGKFSRQRSCARPPRFLRKSNIPQPVLIDLSQQRFKGLAMHYGKNYEKSLHPDLWGKYEHFSTYTVDEYGNLYLVPMPFISINENTFDLQKNIYKLNSETGDLEIFMHLEDVRASSNNPYGLNSIAYDCDDKTLWVSAVDESDYKNQKGVIYHIDPVNKSILDTIEGFDVLSMAIIKSEKGKYLLLGSARDNGLYSYKMNSNILDQKPKKLFSLPSANQHIRKIKIKGNNQLELQAIPFTYSLISQTEKKHRVFYNAIWIDTLRKWKLNSA